MTNLAKKLSQHEPLRRLAERILASRLMRHYRDHEHLDKLRKHVGERSFTWEEAKRILQLPHAALRRFLERRTTVWDPYRGQRGTTPRFEENRFRL
jgi:hypothetical protein